MIRDEDKCGRENGRKMMRKKMVINMAQDIREDDRGKRLRKK